MISTRFREETAWEILKQTMLASWTEEVAILVQSLLKGGNTGYLLCGVGSVVHQQKLKILGVVDEESLVAGGHHVASLLVGAITNLSLLYQPSILFISEFSPKPRILYRSAG